MEAGKFSCRAMHADSPQAVSAREASRRAAGVVNSMSVEAVCKKAPEAAVCQQLPCISVSSLWGRVSSRAVRRTGEIARGQQLFLTPFK